ncbi:kinesin motor domain containing protein [Stylonychia lemnae]|uniref:Kinesin motor domain containing protein n=1 Tax=Stylonychia lemnae TaxID=5949 RepID=A0A078AC80_STYLE|nr:kinesin motor domain containing protein [Stylonychia lemnae]|eukprot:CDW78393.1 kinesin motor domain containing protein [Stylonychia lemnae]
MAGTHSFSFDRVFGPLVRQSDIFTEVAKPVVDGLLNGFNGTVFCYGQTGSGKTFTMEGADLYNEELKGLLPRMFVYLFKQIEKADSALEFNIKCSYMEIYMEKIQDLLDPKKNNLQVKEEKGKGIYVADATEVYVTTPEEMFEVMRAGSKNRSIAATRMNEKSSRSHSVFILTVNQKNTKTDASKLGKLYLCDLAGSEKAGKTQASGQTLEEAKMINKSLSALGNVINALTEGKAGGHIPYRDSKLTRILQESLGGNSQTCLVITCSLSAYNDRETLSTLRFGNRAKNIKNKVTQNAERSAKELLILLNDANGRIDKLTELVKLVQSKMNELMKQIPDEEKAKIKQFLDEAKTITTAKDFDYLMAKLKGQGTDELQKVLEENKTEEDQLEQDQSEYQSEDGSQTARRRHARNASEISKYIMPPSTEQQDGTDVAAKSEEQAVHIFKLNQEITKIKEDLDKVNEEKKDLEDEVKRRNEEIYQMNEKQILQEINQSMIDQKQVNDLQGKLERVQDINIKRVGDMSKLKQCIERLRCDLNVLFLSKKLNKDMPAESMLDDSGVNATQEASADSDKFVSEQIQNTLDYIYKLEQQLKDDITTFDSDNPFQADRQINHERRRSQNIDPRKMDTTVISEIEYLNILPDMDMDDSSFLKNSYDGLKNGDSKNDEEQVQRISELEKIVEIQKKELDELAQIKQSQLKDEDQQKEEETKIKLTLEEELEKIKKQLEEKENQLKEVETNSQKEILAKDKQLQELQGQMKFDKEQFEKAVSDNIDRRLVYELESKNKLLQDKNKIIFTEVITLRKDIETKDTEIEKATQKASQLEKKLLLQQRLLQQQQAVQKLPNISQMMMPFQQNGQIQFGTYGDMAMNPPQQMQNVQVQQPVNLNQNDVPLFFNRKVIKPVKGGGGGSKNQIPQVNPYGSFKPQSQPLNFNEFISRTSNPGNGGSFKAKTNISNYNSTTTPTLGNMNAPIIKPEHQKEFQKQILDAQQTPQQIRKLQQQQQEAMRKVKKEIYYQKYKEAKELTKKSQLEETNQSGDSDDEDDDDDDEDEEETQNQRRPNQMAEISKIASSQDQHRRGKSVHHSSRPSTATGNVEKQKKSLKSKITSAFKNFF